MKSSYETIKLLLADDYELVRIGLRTIFEKNTEFDVIKDAINGYDAIELAMSQEPDVVLMDIEMPFYSGIEAAAFLNIKYPEIKVILISAYDEEKIKIGDLTENVRGYLLKGRISNDIVNTVRKVNEGFYVFNSKILANYLEFVKEIDDNNTNNIVFEENPLLDLIN